MCTSFVVHKNEGQLQLLKIEWCALRTHPYEHVRSINIAFVKEVCTPVQNYAYSTNQLPLINYSFYWMLADKWQVVGSRQLVVPLNRYPSMKKTVIDRFIVQSLCSTHHAKRILLCTEVNKIFASRTILRIFDYSTFKTWFSVERRISDKNHESTKLLMILIMGFGCSCITFRPSLFEYGSISSSDKFQNTL